MSSDPGWRGTASRDLVLALGVILLGSLIAWRAVHLPMTHDEASTWINYRHLDLWSCRSNYTCWGTANNHWLNTLLLQWSAGLFGESPWALRLPNILAGWGYGLIAALIARRYSTGVVASLGAWLLLCGHVYLLDFFSLARGYGLMALGVIGSTYSLLRYVEHFRIGWLLAGLGFLTGAILANFTALLAWAAMGSAWGVWLMGGHRWKIFARHLVAWVVHAGLLYWLLRYPLKTLRDNGEFAWGTEGIPGMLRDLFSNLLAGAAYLGNHTVPLVLSFVAVSTLVVIALAGGQTSSLRRRAILLTGLLLGWNLLLITIQQALTGSMAPVGRKAVYLVPLLFLPLALAGTAAPRKTPWAGWILVVLVSWHLIRVLPGSIRSCREWWYDAHYPTLLSEILPAGADNDSVRLGTSWIFNPALCYYRATDSLPLGGLAYERPLSIDTTMQYYFVEPSDSTGMGAAGFTMVRTLGPFLLFNRRPNGPG